MKLAIFGGTFDPIHSAHLIVAREARDRLHLDRVVFIPAANPPHKSGIVTPYEDRVKMAELACAREPRLAVSRIEDRPGKSYSIDTIHSIRAALDPGDELFFLIGADAFAEIGTWHRWQEVVAAVTFIVVTRPGHDYAVPPGARVARLDTVALPDSSSEIRAKLAAGEAPEQLPSAVLDYVRAKNLYGAR